ncbi:type II secretion system minor pseudopilin GspK [Erwinia psidii]|uniref:Type II secretion system protein K n=1 Tax=Erwinia psidii TaxID=69224 RepID=A0A3N6UW46_9GAMM|nr:type II secretion system minor pseudopilin GspK [Erwinia psidii]MCX8958085.1 hypothetical protein [Erwinia psidii]MCX8962485.1 hypothetical protein [Erwinia psidii]MCX8966381.1 hypothetical protein [Erwinia psidii]RQM37065.1 hypothetical protein EB241_16775 [Erwinia psidii]
MKIISERGIALLLVLLMIATMSAIAIATQEYWMHAFSRGSSQQQQIKQKWLALSAENILIHHYSTAFSAAVLRPSLIGRQPPLQLDGNTFNVAVRDFQACFNINALFNEKKKGKSPRENVNSSSSDDGEVDDSNITGDNDGNTALHGNEPETAETTKTTAALTFPQQVFIRLLMSSGREEAQAREILAGIITLADRQGRRFADITELRLTGVFSPTEWRTLAGQLCALPDDQLKINVNGLNASHSVLLAALLDASLNEKEVEELLSARPKKGWHTLKALQQLTVPEGIGEKFTKAGSFLSLNSEFFALEIEIDHQQPFMMRSLIQRSDKQFNVYRRQFGMSE